MLLRHGANPDLRDEDGKTPLDKARERNDEGHREVAQLLQSPGDWMVTEPASATSGGNKIDSTREDGGSDEVTPPPRGDPEMVARYVSSLLPVFCSTFTATMIPSVKRAALGLVKKLVHYMDGPTLDTVSRAEVAGKRKAMNIDIILTLYSREYRTPRDFLWPDFSQKAR